MSKLFLVSSFKDVANKLVECEKDLQGKTITFIPTASIVDKVDFFVASGKKALIKLGLIVDELEVSTATFEEIESKISNNDYIYITGGNTFFLLQELKRTGADKVIIKAVNGGKMYIGESAGAIIVSPNIEYAKAMDSAAKAPNLKDFDALNLTRFYTVPHCTNFPFKKAVEKIIANYGEALNLTPINNKQAIWVNDNEIEVINN